MNSIDLTPNQFCVLASIASTNVSSTAEVARVSQISWHSANVAIRALQAKGLLTEDTREIEPSVKLECAVARYGDFTPKTISRRQFAALLAVMAGNRRTKDVAAFGGMPWHSANVALSALERKGFVNRDGVRPQAFAGLTKIELQVAA